MPFLDIGTSKSGPNLTCFVHFHLKMCFSPQRRAIFQHLNFNKWSDTLSFLNIFTWKRASRHSGVQFFNISTSKSAPNLTCFVHFHLKMCFSPQRRAIFQHLNFNKWSDTLSFLNILTWKCASRHNGVHFFNISTSKSAPNLTCFVHFHLKMCFSPQRRAIFQHLNFNKWSDNLSFLNIFTWKRASRHSGVQFFNISTSKSAPNLTCFVHFHLKMCFSPQRRAFFQHLNFKKCSEPDVFCTF